MLTKAITWGYLDVNPLRGVKKLQEPDGRLRYLDTEEIDRLLTACPAHLHPIVVCALHTGMRRGEILGLTWDRVDMKQRFVPPGGSPPSPPAPGNGLRVLEPRDGNSLRQHQEGVENGAQEGQDHELPVP